MPSMSYAWVYILESDCVLNGPETEVVLRISSTVLRSVLLRNRQWCNQLFLACERNPVCLLLGFSTACSFFLGCTAMVVHVPYHCLYVPVCLHDNRPLRRKRTIFIFQTMKYSSTYELPPYYVPAWEIALLMNGSDLWRAAGWTATSPLLRAVSYTHLTLPTIYSV